MKNRSKTKSVLINEQCLQLCGLMTEISIKKGR